MGGREVQQAYSALADVYIGRLGSLDVVHPDDRTIIARHLGRVRGPVLDLGCGPGHLTGFLHAAGCDVFTGPVSEPFEHKVVTAYRWPVQELAARLAAAGFVEVDRLEREQDGERRPHGVLVARAV